MSLSFSAGLRLAATAAVTAVLLSACGSDAATGTSASTSTSTNAVDSLSAASTPASAATSAAPSDTDASGSITVYSGRNEELVGPLLEQFTTDTGIEVEVRYAGSGELGAQLLTEGDRSPADVFLSQDAGALGAVAAAGLFAPVDADALAAIPARFSAADGSWLGVSGRARVVLYQPSLVPTAPDTIDALLAPEWKGRIAYAPSNASWQSFVTGLRVLRGDDGARSWLTAFKAQEPVAYEGNGAIRDAVNAGEIAMGLVNHYYLVELAGKAGAAAVTARNQFMAAGDAGGLINVAGVGVLATAANPAAAQAFAAYLVSESAQRYFATETGEFPLVAGIPGPADTPSLTELSPPAIDLSDLADLEATQELLVETGLLTT